MTLTLPSTLYIVDAPLVSLIMSCGRLSRSDRQYPQYKTLNTKKVKGKINRDFLSMEAGQRKYSLFSCSFSIFCTLSIKSIFSSCIGNVMLLVRPDMVDIFFGFHCCENGLSFFFSMAANRFSTKPAKVKMKQTER